MQGAMKDTQPTYRTQKMKSDQEPSSFGRCG